MSPVRRWPSALRPPELLSVPERLGDDQTPVLWSIPRLGKTLDKVLVGIPNCEDHLFRHVKLVGDDLPLSNPPPLKAKLPSLRVLYEYRDVLDRDNTTIDGTPEGAGPDAWYDSRVPLRIAHSSSMTNKMS